MEHCEKLSELIPMEDGENFNAYLSRLYPIYKNAIADNNFVFRGKPVKVFTTLNFNLQHQTFEHLTTKGNQDRLYNVERCERLKWIHDILSNCCNGCADYRVFQDTNWKPHRKERRFIIWCVKEDYVIILEERERDYMLITAYKILYDNKRNDLETLFNKSRR